MRGWFYPHLYPHGIITGLAKPFDEPLHSVSALLLHRVGYMAVPVQCECCGIVSGVLLNGFYVVSGAESVDYIGVPQIMEPMLFDAVGLQDFLKLATHVPLSQMMTIGVQISSHSNPYPYMKRILPKRKPYFEKSCRISAQDLKHTLKKAKS